MRRLRKWILAVAVVTLLVILWKIDPRQVWHYLAQVGWGFALILAQEIVAHSFNAVAWRWAFTKEHGKAFSFLELLKLRIAGDGVNYLTPSGTIAGEFIRADSLKESHASETRYASVAVAKFAQGLGQALFVLIGLFCIIGVSNPVIREYPRVIYGFTAFLGAAVLALIPTGLWTWKRLVAGGRTGPRDPSSGSPSWLAALGDVPRQCLTFLGRHPERFTVSALFFIAAYAWASFEGYWICRFLGVPVAVSTALIIEVLSNFIDTAMFLVPAKVGTQEAGKTAIFVMLGLPAGAGFAFGVVRHIRELVWANIGLLICSLHKNYTPATPEARPLDPVSN